MHIRVARAFLPLPLLLAASVLVAQKQPFDVHALMQLARISDPQLSPDGHSVAFTVQTIDIEKDTKPKQIYIVPLAGGEPRKIADDAERPRWSPDSKQIAFVSNRGEVSQIWLMDADGANPKPVTSLSTGAGGVLYSRDGKNLVFTSEVFPECGADDNCSRQKLDAEKNSKVKTRIATGLLYRHWTTWQGARRSHLLAVPVSGGLVRDLTPGNRDDRAPVPRLARSLFGKLIADKGYLSQPLFERLFCDQGLQLITRLRKNMANALMDWGDQGLLRKRAIIESVNDQLKNISQIEHSRHRSPANFLVNLVGGLIAYCFQPKKPSLGFDARLGLAA